MNFCLLFLDNSADACKHGGAPLDGEQGGINPNP